MANPDLIEKNKSALLDPKLAEGMQALADESKVHPSLDLDTFVRVYLPALAQNERTDLSMNPWVVDIAKGPYNPVDIIHNGTVTFTVPPMFNRKRTRLNDAPQESLSRLVETAEQKKASNPLWGQNFLHEGLLKRVGKGIVVPEELKSWNEVLVKYGYDPLPIEANNGIMEGVKGDDPADIFSADEYDEL